VQHNCIDNKCGPTGTRPVYQERAKTNQTRAQIAHTRNIEDIVLNTAQMRDAIHVQKFRVAAETLDFDAVVLRSAAKELDARKAGERFHPSCLLPQEGVPRWLLPQSWQLLVVLLYCWNNPVEGDAAINAKINIPFLIIDRFLGKEVCNGYEQMLLLHVQNVFVKLLLPVAEMTRKCEFKYWFSHSCCSKFGSIEVLVMH
jgi:hypothetical protein